MSNNIYSKNKKHEVYKSISIEELKKRDQNIYIQISGTELSIEVSLLDKKNLEDSDNQRLLDLYYQYLIQGKKDGYSSPYVKIKLKDVCPLFEKFFKHSPASTFRELSV